MYAYQKGHEHLDENECSFTMNILYNTTEQIYKHFITSIYSSICGRESGKYFTNKSKWKLIFKIICQSRWVKCHCSCLDFVVIAFLC